MAVIELASKRKVNIDRLKAFSLELPRNSHLREIILAEKNDMDVNEFLLKMDLWMKLFKIEFS